VGESVERILEQLLRFVEQAADQRQLAVVDRSAGDEAQQALARLPLQERAEFILC
jgi:DNA-directed RNA polymerase specialized sigma24 family protein